MHIHNYLSITFDILIANISGTSQNIQNLKKYVIDNDSSRVRRRKSGEPWFTIHKVGLVHVSLDPPVSFFDRLYFGPYRVLGHDILHALEIDQVLLAHTTKPCRGSRKIVRANS